jgi:hypothetical protein
VEVEVRVQPQVQMQDLHLVQTLQVVTLDPLVEMAVPKVLAEPAEPARLVVEHKMEVMVHWE